MLPYLHILVRVEDDGSLHALGAFTTKEKQLAYQKASGLADNQVRFDFYNGPFEEEIKVIYAGHRRWNMDRFQLGGYFKSEGEAWTWVTQEGYVSVLRIDTSYEEERILEKEALERYAKLQKRWRLASYEDLIAREGAEKARANIVLRFYEDALESFKPKSQRDIRALYALVILILAMPIAVFFFLSSAPEYGEDMESVNWLPEYASMVSFYRSSQVQVYEFKVSASNFKRWAESQGMVVRRLAGKEILSRYKAYIPTDLSESGNPAKTDGNFSPEDFSVWQNAISISLSEGLIAESDAGAYALYDPQTGKAYFEHLIGF
ncbi:hypothetical protein [Coraliomargarita parva]|uniref:hypothetical protein n=1 Tax=Coraliomargarita parva TaxID=3014050 RepID=UPI0022B3CA71|nr:hypothetical protein [Coraliomargarita parva]